MEYKYRRTFVVGRSATGKPIRKEVRSNNKAEFRRRCRELEVALDAGVAASKVTVQEFAEYWFKTFKKGAVGASQERCIQIALNNHILPAIGFVPIQDVTCFMLEDFLRTRADKSNSLIRNLVSVLHQIFRRAAVERRIPYDPTIGMNVPRGTKTSRRALSPSECDSFRAACKQSPVPMRGLLGRLLLECGLRRGEAVALLNGDVDWNDGAVTIDKAVEFVTHSNKATIKTTKTEAGVRIVPLPADLLDDLRQLRRADDLPLFYKEDGGMLSYTKLRRMWEMIVKDWDLYCGAKTYRNKIVEHAVDVTITPHYLRHTYATNLARQRVPLDIAKYFCGHSDIRTTSEVYTHVDFEMAKSALDAITAVPHECHTNEQKQGKNRQNEGKCEIAKESKIITFPACKVEKIE